MSGNFGEATHNRGRGAAAERDAERWLIGEGYRIVARNVETKAGEIDLVAEERGVLCFVEVKARSSARFGPAIGAVDRRKQRRLARAASLYLVRNPTKAACRFDVLGLDPAPDGWHYTLVRDAFQVPG